MKFNPGDRVRLTDARIAELQDHPAIIRGLSCRGTVIDPQLGNLAGTSEFVTFIMDGSDGDPWTQYTCNVEHLNALDLIVEATVA